MKIFVVDDDATARLLVVDALHGLGHDIHELGTATALLDAVDQNPDLVLLDIEMPEMDGIRACGALRQRDVHQPRVMFVSSHDDLDSRLAAYDAGGNDFIVKPFTPQELVQKVQNTAALLTQRTELAARASFAQETAFTAMASMGEMGKVLHFLRVSFACREAEQLSRALLDTLHEFDLHGLVQIRLLDEIRCLSSQGECTPLECSILSHAAGMDRIFQFRDRLVLNYPGLTLVAQNLPLDDADRVGRLRDHLALLAEGASEKVQAIIHEKQRQSQSGVIRNVVAELSQTLLALEGH